MANIRRDEAQLIITIDAKESAEYQKVLSSTAKGVQDIKKLTAGTEEYNAALQEQAAISRRLSQTDYTKLSIKQIQDRRAQLVQLQRTLPGVTFAEAGFERELQQVNTALATNAQRTRAVTTTMNGFGQTLSSLSPTLANVSGGVGDVLSKIRLLFATPIGWILGIVAAVGAAAKQWYDYNDAILENRKITEDITGLTGQAAQEIRSQAIAISQSTGLSITETLNAAKNAVKNFGVDYNAALDIISTGLVDAGNKQNLFLESVSEYSVFFGQAGFSFQQFSDIINSGIDLGIYQDKLPDAIKEFTLSINEQTKASKDALENAFGKPFTDKLLGGVKDGSITAADALGQISSEAEKVGINSQQAAQLTADLFRGAGEDAGGALNVFRAVNDALADEPRLLTDIQKAQIESIRLNTELEQSKAKALETEGFLIFKQTFINTWKEVQIVWYNFLEQLRIGITAFVDTVKIQVAIIKASWLAIPEQLKIVKDGFFNAFSEIGNAASALFDSIKNVFTLDFDAAALSFDKFKQAILNSGSSINNARKEASKFGTDAIRSADAAARAQIEADKRVLAEQAKLEKQAQSIVNKSTNKTTASSTASKKADKKEDQFSEIPKSFTIDTTSKVLIDQRIKQLEEAAKREQAILEESYLQGKISLEQYEIEKLRITSANLATRIDVLDTYGQQESDKRRELNIQLLQVESELVQERAAQIGDLENAQLSELERKFANRLITEEEFNLQSLQVQLNFYDEQLRLLEENGLIETEVYKKIQAEKLKTQTDFNKQKEDNERRTQDLQMAIQREGLGAAAELFSLGADLLGQDEKARKKHASAIKAFEVAQVAINLASEVQGIWRNANLNPINAIVPGWGPLFAGIQTGFAVGRAGLQAAKISAQQFYLGGKIKELKALSGQRITERPNIPALPGGDNVLIAAKPGEVMMNDNQQATLKQIAGNDIFERLRIPGFNGGGVVPSLPSTTPNLRPQVLSRNPAPVNNTQINDLMMAVNSIVQATQALPQAISAMNLKTHVVYTDIEKTKNTVDEIKRIASI